MAAARVKQHVVAVPLPLQGHLNPLMRFCKLLAKHDGFLITFVDFDHVHTRLQEVHQIADAAAALPADDSSASPSRIRRVRIPCQGIDLSHSFVASFRDYFNAMVAMGPPLEQLIVSLSPPVTCLLSDFNVTLPTQDVADKLGIPRIVLYPCCASRLLLSHYLTQGEHLSVEGAMEALERAKTTRGEVFCKGLPGLPTLYSHDIPHYKHVVDDTSTLWKMTTESWRASNARAHSVVVNSFEDLEESTFATLWKCCDVPIYDVGFWGEAVTKDNPTSLWKEDTACLTWLDKQPPSSVLFISFGSTSLLSESQFEEFQDGLISSQQRFLWVFRQGLVRDIDHLSSVATIVSKCQGRGLVIGWAPQMQVLAHPSVGAFLTHCGWNSTTESIVNGVPMLCWPYFADQQLNARLIVDVWKVGLGFNPSKHDNSFIDRDEVEAVIRAMMEGQAGLMVRQNVAKLKEKSSCCLQGSGSSCLKLKTLVESLLA